jgi:hypothetical protein
MSNYASYNTYVSPEAEQAPARSLVTAEDVGGSMSVTIRDGVATASTHTHEMVRSSELSPYAETDWRSTALKPSGFPASEITADTLVSLGGTQGRVQDFVAAGVMVKNPDGSYELAAAESVEGQDQQDPLEHPDAAVFPEEIAQTIDNALEPFNQSTVDSGVSLALASVTGDLDLSSVVRNVAMKSGVEPKDVQQRVQFTMDAYQAQTDRYVTKSGIHEEDLGDFYDFCQANKRELTAVLQRQVHQRDMSGWKGLISRFQSSTAPSLQVLQENGFQTRTLGKEAEVRISGMWMTITQAAKAGLV